MVEMRTSDKTAIITGDTQGIGKEIARHFLLNGYRVVIADVDRKAGLETQRELDQSGPVQFLHTDVADDNSVRTLVDQVIDRFHSIDALINNAGIMLTRPLADLSLAEWNRVLAVNLTGM